MVYIVIGTGVDAAIINGQLYYGESNTSGEVGHITVDRCKIMIIERDLGAMKVSIQLR